MRGRSLLPWALLAVAAALPWIAGALDQSYYVGFARRVMIFAIAAASLNFIMGIGGMVSLGHAAYFGLGAYAVAIAMTHGVTSAWIAWPLAVAVAAGMALVIGAISLRTRGVYFIMSTLAFAQMIYYLSVGLKQYGGEDGLSLPQRSTVGGGIDLADETTLYFVVLLVLALSVLLMNRAIDARFGRVLAGIRENEPRMESIGFDTTRYKLVAVAMAGGLGPLAGALVANHNLFVSPAALHWTQSATLVVMVLRGGLGYRYGGVLGAIALLVLEEALAAVTDFWHLPLGLILLAVVFLAPRGLAGLAARRPAR
jgi:branched-chain amino acid transport system permease protein